MFFLHMDDEESEARFYSRTGDNERKAQGNFRREEVRCASGVAWLGRDGLPTRFVEFS